MTDAASKARPLVLSPFRGLRYAQDRISDLAAVTAPPYDLLDQDSIAALEAAEPHNIVRVILPRFATWPRGDGTLPEADHVDHYAEAANLLQQWRRDGVLVADDDASLYVYERVAGGSDDARAAEAARMVSHNGPADPAGGGAVLLRGLIGAVELREAAEEVILPHEDVLPGPVADRLALMRACAANLEPILLAYDGGGTASEIVEATTKEPPLVETRSADGVTHRVWRISDADRLSAIAVDLAPRQALIADGHHRYATYLELQRELRTSGRGAGPWDSGLALLVDQRAHPLELSAIHRTLARCDLESFVASASGVFQVDDFGRNVEEAHSALSACRGVSHGFLLTDGEAWVLLRLALTSPQARACGEAAGEAGVLDSEVLHRLLLERLAGVSDERIGYAHDEDSATRAAREKGQLALILNPVDLTTVQQIARAGGRMPRKSTSFGPKPRTGFIMRAFSDS